MDWTQFAKIAFVLWVAELLIIPALFALEVRSRRRREREFYRFWGAEWKDLGKTDIKIPLEVRLLDREDAEPPKPHRKEIPYKDLEAGKYDGYFNSKRELLISWGFDPDREVLEMDDRIHGMKIYLQYPDDERPR